MVAHNIVAHILVNVDKVQSDALEFNLSTFSYLQGMTNPNCIFANISLVKLNYIYAIKYIPMNNIQIKFEKNNFKMKLKFLIYFTIILVSNKTLAQDFTDLDAINIFKTYPTKYNIEGVYEIYYRSELFLNGELVGEQLNSKSLKSENKKICIYTENNTIKTKMINFQNDFDNYNFYKFQIKNATFLIDVYGTITYNVLFSFTNQFNEKYKVSTSKVSKADNELSWFFRQDGFTPNGDMFYFNNQIVLKKIFTPK
jgi:hypothetical protein